MACLRDASAQDSPEPVAAVTIDQQTFTQYFIPTFELEADFAQSLADRTTDFDMKLREIAADESVTKDQLDRIRLAAYSEKAAELRRRFDGRRAVVGKEFPDLTSAHLEFEKVMFSSYRDSPRRSLMQAVYEQVLSSEQKQKHQALRAARRGRLVRASIVNKVSLINQQVAMTQKQRVAFAKLINREMPPANLYDDQLVETVLMYAMSLIPPEELKSVFDSYQIEALQPHLVVDPHIRESLRERGALQRITAYRDALERKAGASEKNASELEDATSATP